MEQATSSRRPFGQLSVSPLDGTVSRSAYERTSPLRCRPHSCSSSCSSSFCPSGHHPDSPSRKRARLLHVACSSSKKVAISKSTGNSPVSSPSSSPRKALTALTLSGPTGVDSHKSVGVANRGDNPASSSSSHHRPRPALRLRPSMIGDMTLVRRGANTQDRVMMSPAASSSSSSSSTTGAIPRTSGNLLDTVLVEEPQPIPCGSAGSSSMPLGGDAGSFEIYADPPEEDIDEDSQALAPPLKREHSPQKLLSASPARDIKSSKHADLRTAQIENEENVPPLPLASAEALAPTVLCV